MRSTIAPFVVCLALAVSSWNCSSAPARDTGSGSRNAEQSQFNALELRKSVRAGLESVTTTPCREAALLGVLDIETAGERLNELLTEESSAAGECRELVAIARAIRGIRVGRSDLEADMLHPMAAVRAVAVRTAAITELEGAGQIIALGFADAQAEVRVAAYFAAAHLAEPELLERLRLVPQPEDSSERYWHCRARARIDRAIECEGAGTVFDIVETNVTGAGAEIDRCSVAQSGFDGQGRRDALWFMLNDAFHAFAQPLDRLVMPQSKREPCRIQGRAETRLLAASATHDVDRALVAAAILWRDHPALGTVKFTPVDSEKGGLAQDIIRCSADPDCPSNTRCIRLPGGQPGGVCGNPKRAREQARVRVEVYSSGCWSFADCPPFYSCFYLDPSAMHGVCVRR